MNVGASLHILAVVQNSHSLQPSLSHSACDLIASKRCCWCCAATTLTRSVESRGSVAAACGMRAAVRNEIGQTESETCRDSRTQVETDFGQSERTCQFKSDWPGYLGHSGGDSLPPVDPSKKKPGPFSEHLSAQAGPGRAETKACWVT